MFLRTEALGFPQRLSQIFHENRWEERPLWPSHPHLQPSNLSLPCVRAPGLSCLVSYSDSWSWRKVWPRGFHSVCIYLRTSIHTQNYSWSGPNEEWKCYPISLTPSFLQLRNIKYLQILETPQYLSLLSFTNITERNDCVCTSTYNALRWTWVGLWKICS